MLRISSKEDYKNSYRNSLENQNSYWEEVASTFKWKEKWDEVQSGDFDKLNVKWFDGGKLNITENCIDRHLKDHGKKLAIIWEPNDPSQEKRTFTYEELHQNVCRFSNVLKDMGVEKGDRVCFYMSMVPELLFGVLACARIGAVHSVVFGGFSANALAGRINDCKASIVVTNDEAPRGDKNIPLKQITDEALKACPEVKDVLVLKRSNKDIDLVKGRDHLLNNLLDKAHDNFEAVEMDSESPLFILYTSGSTGKPKGLVHTTAGYMVWASETFKHVFQTGNNDIFWCSADIGWITGHSYLTYGPLLNGATQIMFEGIPTWPNPGRFWDIIEKYSVSHFYTAPTAIRALQACDPKFPKEADLSSLKVLGTVGEPINEEAWEWYNKEIGQERCPIVDTWWQTETGGIMISNLAGVTDSIPCHATKPLPGVEPVLVSNDNEVLEENPSEGSLCLNRPWPGMARTIYDDHERYKQTYFSTFKGRYFTGDGAKRDESGNYRITGRVDDVINVSGHRLGTAEIEDAIDEHESVVEAAVVGYPHEIKGQGIMAYVICTNLELNQGTLLANLNKIITKQIGPIAKLDRLIMTPGLPKTRSGKIMRRILRKLAANEIDSLGDTSTLLNPEIVEVLIESFHE